MEKIRVMVVDDHPTFRDGLCRFLKEEEDIEVIGTAANGEDAVRLARELCPDVTVIDVVMPGLNGIETARRISAATPGTAILMVSAFGYEAYLLASLQAGAKGYMVKDTPVNELISAIRLVHSGQDVFDHKAISKVLRRVSGGGKGPRHLTELRERELDVLRLAAKGMSNGSIADQLGISERTVQTHMVNIFRKLEVGSRTEAVLHAVREGWLTLNDLH